MDIDRRRPKADENDASKGVFIISDGLDALIAQVTGAALKSYTYLGSGPEAMRPQVLFHDEQLVPSRTDTVRFGVGAQPSTLVLSWTVVDTDDGQKQALSIAWGSAGGVHVVLPDADSPPGVGIERFEFTDGTVLSMQQMLDLAPDRPSNSPQILVGEPIGVVEVLEDELWSYQVSPSAFEILGDRAATFEVRRVGGTTELPAWLNFDPMTGTLSGTPDSSHVGPLQLEITAILTDNSAQDFKNLVDQNFVSRHGYLEREQVRIEQEADLANQRSRLREMEASLREVQGQRQALMAETRRATLDSTTEAQQRLDALDQEWKKADSRGKLMRLTSPVDGTVQQLAVHTEGGVVTEAQPLMVIVPSDNPLEVEAFFENKDIGFVKAGQEAAVKIETFQYTKYGTLDAKVATVSHDAINDEKRGLIYSSRVRMPKTSLLVDGTDVSLSPGMAVTVEVKTGQRRVIEYFLAPLLQHTSESLRER